MVIPQMFVTGRGRWVILFSVVNLIFTSAHSAEDLRYGVHLRYGLSFLTAALLIAVVFALQLWAAALVARDIRLGYWICLAIAAVWFTGAILDHSGEILFEDPYRFGTLSKTLELGVIVSSALWALAATRMVFQRGEHARPHSESGRPASNFAEKSQKR